MGIMNPNSTSYQHPWEPNLSDLHTAMDYLITGEPALRVISNFQGNIVVQGDINIDSNINIATMPEVSVFTDSGNTLAIQGTVYQGTNPWVISGNSSPNGPQNEIYVKLTNECLSVKNCVGETLITNSSIIVGEDPVGTGNPLPVDITNTCLSVQNCGTDGVLNVSGAITVEGVEVTIENPFPVDLRNNCIGVENCEGTVLNVAGNISILSGEDPVSLLNPLPVNLTNECLSVQNCTGTRLNVNSNSIIMLNELPVGGLNPFPVNITNTCLSVQNCGPDGVLNVSGAITVEGVEVTVETPFPVDLRNECLSVQNCAGTQLSVKLSDGVNNIGFVVNDNDGQSPGTYSVPVENFNMVWNGASWDRMPGNAISGVAVNITNGCLSVANCAESVLAIAGDVNVQIGGVDVSADNPVPVTIPNCVSIQNCGESTLGINGNVGLVYDNQVVDEGHPLPVTGSVNATINGEVSVAGANPDAFGRARVSEVFTLGDYKHLYALDPNFNDKTANGGSITFDPNQAMAILATTSATGSYAIHQTKFYHHYQPGKSQLIYSSFHFRAPHRNVTKRTGYFDDRDGIYFEQVGSDTADGSTVGPTTQTLNWVIRTYVSGSPDESNYVTTVNGSPYTYKRRVPQSEWNADKCDGTGASGFNLDVTKTQLCFIDFQWLGVGRVRCGFVHNGELITAHEYYHSNVLPVVYMANPNLPVRCEIRNTGTTPGGAMDQVCATVMSEGGYVESGIDWSIYTTARTTPTPGQTRFPLVAIRLKNTFNTYPNRLSVRPLSLSLFAKTESIVYELCKLPSAGSLSTTAPGGLVWTSADANSGVEYCTNATGFTSADVDRFASGYVPSGSSQNSLSPVATGSLTSAKKNVICQNIDSTDSEVFVVIVSTIAAGQQISADVAAAIQWREIY